MYYHVLYRNPHHSFWHVWAYNLTDRKEAEEEERACNRAFFYCETVTELKETEGKARSRRRRPSWHHQVT